MALSYLPEAVPTAIGWAHPLTGEQLTAGALDEAQLDGAMPVDFYKPNAGRFSFLDPEGVARTLFLAVRKGRNIQFTVHSLDEVESVEWDFGDGETLTAGVSVRHVYAEEGLYTINIVVNYVGGDPVPFTINHPDFPVGDDVAAPGGDI